MISIIVVGHNHRKDLKGCFDSLLKSGYKNFKIIFVDNGSSDGSLDFVRKNYPKIIAIKNNNTGYAGGNNVGIRKAIRLKTKYIFILNPDTIIDENCLKQLSSQAKENRILQPLFLIYQKGKKTNLINTTGSYLNFMGISYCSNYREKKQAAHSSQIPSASGAGFFIPVKIFKDIGLFKSRFFMYFEDTDLSWRARMAGYEIYLQNEAIVYHKYSFSKSKKKYYFAERNRLDFIFSSFEIKTILLIFVPFLINEILITIFSLIDGWFFYKIAASASFLGRIGPVLKDRRRLKRRVRDRELVQYLSGEVSFSEKKIPLQNFYNQVYCTYWSLVKKLI